MNIAFVTVTDANYSLYTNLLLHSLSKIGQTEKLYVIQCDLPDIYKTNMGKLYSNIGFYDIDKGNYKSFDGQGSKFFKFEMFKIKGYDKLIFMDSDIIFIKSLNYFIEKEVSDLKFAMMRENHRETYNAGLIVMDKEYINDKIYMDLIRYPWTPNEFGHDQQIFNKYFDGRIQRIHAKYNWFVADPPPDMNEIVGLHYFIKNFTESDPKRLPRDMHRIWFQYYHEVQKILGME